MADSPCLQCRLPLRASSRCISEIVFSCGNTAMSKKAQKKRHTKPCRYFQVNKCHHSAEVCDFAHVPPTPLDKDSTMCRYFLAGRCTNGQACKYKHGTEGYSVGHPTAVEHWSQSTTDPTSPTLYGSYPIPYGHVQPSPSFNSTFTFPSVTESILFAPPRSRDSIDTASTSISSLDSDEIIVVTNDPKYTEHSHSHQSQVYVADDSPIVHVPPFFPGMHMNLHSPTSVCDYGFPNMNNNAMQTLEVKPRPATRAMSKQKTMKYKTKPCKFFTMERGCPNGHSCTFIHDENRNSLNSSPQPVSPVKYPSLADETDKRNFFPITWRVIGGGVRVAVAKDDEKDRTSSNTGGSPKPNPRSLPPLKVPTRQRSNSIPSTTSNTLIHVEHLFSAESPGVL